MCAYKAICFGPLQLPKPRLTDMTHLTHPKPLNVLLCQFFAASLLALLAACGGSGSNMNLTPTSFDILGVAATGAPMSGAQVLMVDALGNEVCNTSANAEGRYICTLKGDAVVPMVVSASKNLVTHYAPITQLNQGTANITPLTTLIAAQISPTGQPQALAEQLKTNNQLFTIAQVEQAIVSLRNALKPLFTQAGSDINPLTGNFKADGSGHDQVLNALDVQIKPTTSRSNITITLKTEMVSGTELPSVSYVAGQTPPAFPATTALAKLPALDEDLLVADYVQRLNACYSLPKSSRIAIDGVTVQAPACRELFVDNNPANFKNDGLRVGPSGAFPGMFADTSTGALFESVAVEFRYPGDQIRLLLRVTGPTGNKTWSRLRLVRERERLAAVGNQYSYRFSVKPWAEKRRLVNRPEFNYLSTGFSIQVDNVQDNKGTPIFEKVIVSLADTRNVIPSFELRPKPSLSYLAIRMGQTQTSTNNVRIAGHFIDSGTSGQPSRLSPLVNGLLGGEALVWQPSPSTQANWTADEINQIPELTRWKAEFHLLDGSVVTQDYETVTAPLNVAELQGEQWAQLDDSTMNTLISQTRSTGSYLLQNLPDYPVSWTLSGRARAPTEIQTQGYWRNGNTNNRFNDIKAVTTTNRQASVMCSTQSSLDLHCNGNVYGNSYLDGLPLFAFDQREVIWASQNFTYLLQDYGR